MVATGPKQEIPKATGWQIPGALTKHVVLDPGIAYTTADVLLFAGTNPIGFGAMLTATGVAATLKTASVLQPSFLDKHPRIKKLVFDDRTPLRAGGLALLVVAGASAATGAWLPAAASFLFAIANVRLAQSISKKAPGAEGEQKPEAPKTGWGKTKAVATALVKRPDMYLNAGFALAGLMAGGAALFILPVVAVAFFVGMKNTLQGKEEHEGHPKLITASAAGVFAGIGHSNGHGLISAAHALNTVVLAEMERRITPGGAGQIFKDMLGGIRNILSLKSPFRGREDKPAEKGAVVAQPATQPVAVSEKTPQKANDNEHIPAPEVAKSDLDKVDLQEAFKLRAKIPLPANENAEKKDVPQQATPAEHGSRPNRPPAL